MAKYEVVVRVEAGGIPSVGDAIKLVLQNTIENNITDCENDAQTTLVDGVLCVTNKTKVVDVSNLLFGAPVLAGGICKTTVHYSRYKLIFLAVLSAGKTVMVRNYGKQEIWLIKLVSSASAVAGAVLGVEVLENIAAVQSTGFALEIGGLTAVESAEVEGYCLSLQSGFAQHDIKNLGSILLDEQHKGKMFVNGMFLRFSSTLLYGYNLNAAFVSLSVEAGKTIELFDIVWETSRLWLYSGKLRVLAELVMGGVAEVKHLNLVRSFDNHHVNTHTTILPALAVELQKLFIERHGVNSLPVWDLHGQQEVIAMNVGVEAVIVSKEAADFLVPLMTTPVLKRHAEECAPKVLLTKWLESVKSKIGAPDIAKFYAALESLPTGK